MSSSQAQSLSGKLFLPTTTTTAQQVLTEVGNEIWSLLGKEELKTCALLNSKILHEIAKYLWQKQTDRFELKLLEHRVPLSRLTSYLSSVQTVTLTEPSSPVSLNVSEIAKAYPSLKTCHFPGTYPPGLNCSISKAKDGSWSELYLKYTQEPPVGYSLLQDDLGIYNSNSGLKLVGIVCGPEDREEELAEPHWSPDQLLGPILFDNKDGKKGILPGSIRLRELHLRSDLLYNSLAEKLTHLAPLESLTIYEEDLKEDLCKELSRGVVHFELLAYPTGFYCGLHYSLQYISHARETVQSLAYSCSFEDDDILTSLLPSLPSFLEITSPALPAVKEVHLRVPLNIMQFSQLSLAILLLSYFPPDCQLHFSLLTGASEGEIKSFQFWVSGLLGTRENVVGMVIDAKFGRPGWGHTDIEESESGDSVEVKPFEGY